MYANTTNFTAPLQAYHLYGNWDEVTTVSPFSRDEKFLFDFCGKLRDLFREHFENGDIDITDEEFWEIIKA